MTCNCTEKCENCSCEEIEDDVLKEWYKDTPKREEKDYSKYTLNLTK